MDSFSKGSCTCASYQRFALRGFDWLDSNRIKEEEENNRGSNFKHFKIFDEKKKWKKQDTTTFDGFGSRIRKVIQANPKYLEQNTKNERHQLFFKSIEEIHSRNEQKKISKIKGVHRICEREKELKRQTVQSYFQKQMDWVHNTFSRYGFMETPHKNQPLAEKP